MTMSRVFPILGALWLSVLAPEAAERINHEGRILGAPPLVTNAVLFNTAASDAILAHMQIFPRDNAWNEDISRRPVLSNSAAMISQIIADLAADRRTLRPFFEMNFVLVPGAQPQTPIQFVDYPDESDPSPYPIPSNMPVESWPTETSGQALYDWQRDLNGWGGDRHSIIVQPDTGALWETWQSLLIVTNGHTNWQASNGAKFSLTNNTLRPAGWTSADAAGLSMFAGLVRYDECERGMVEHALRLVVKRTRRQYIYPATHYASTTSATNSSVPAMGQRLRLKSGFVVPSNWTRQEQAVLRALQKYGAIVADNGGFFSISVAPDDRFPAGSFGRLSGLSITNFEVIQTTGPLEGPRSPGAPVVDAGPDQAIALGTSTVLRGAVHCTNTTTPSILWKRYSGPTNVTFANPGQTNASVTLTAPGVYTLMLGADDGVHTKAYDSVNITVTPVIRLEMNRSGSNVALRWTGGSAPYRVERSTSLTSPQWNVVLNTNATTTTLRFDSTAAAVFYRVQGQ